MKYTITYTGPDGRKVCRILFADEDAEIEALIRAEGLEAVSVDPPLRQPSPPDPPARSARPARPRRGTPLQIEILSHPSNLADDRTGGLLPWMRVDDEEESRRRKALASQASRAAKGVSKKLYVNPTRGREIVEEIEDALTLGKLDLGVRYTCQQIERIIEREISGGMEILALRIVDRTPFRLREVGSKVYVFEDRRRAVPVAA